MEKIFPVQREKFEDTEETGRSRKSEKDSQQNDQRKMDKWTNIDLQNTEI